MRLGHILALIILVPAISAGTMGSTEAGIENRALVRIEIGSEGDLAAVEAAGVAVYARLAGDEGMLLIAGVAPGEAGALSANALTFSVLDPDPAGKQYYAAYVMPNSSSPNWRAYGELVDENANWAILAMSPEDAGRLAETGVELRAIVPDPKPLPAQAVPATVYSAAAVTADPDVQAMIDAVESLTVYTYTGDLSGEWQVTVGGSPYTISTRYTYSGTPISKATQYVGEHLQDLGLQVEYHQWGGSDYPNVIAELPGQVSPDSIVIICAHLDDMPSGSTAPGADDNASGSTTVLIAADVMKGYTWHYTLRFALWTGEEQGLWGSYYYAQRCYSEGEDIVGVLNLDMVAYNTPGSSRDIDLHADESGVPGSMYLANLFVDVIDAYGLSLIPEIIENGTGASDHASFWDYGYDAVLAIEDWDDFTPYYHTTSDLLQTLDMTYYWEFVKASVATFAHMGIVVEDLSGIGDIAGGEGGLPPSNRLYPARPNPAGSASILRYDISSPGAVELKVYDAGGRVVRTLVAGHHAPGRYEAAWDGITESGGRATPGIYFIGLTAAGHAGQTEKVVLVR